MKALRPRPARTPRRAARGVVMIVTLLALVLILVGATALVRSMRGASLLAGHFAVKRDLLNQAERGMAAALTALNSGALSTSATREADLVAANYSASSLATNAEGIPNVLVKDSDYTSAGFTLADIADSSTGIEIRYVIDRQCTAAGAYSSASCEFLATTGDRGGSDFLKKPGGESRAIYRISVRVKDTRRDSQAFSQAFATR